MRARQITAASSGAAGTFLVAGGSYNHTSGGGAQVVAVPGMLASDNVQLTVQQNDVSLYTLQAVAAAGQFTAYPNTPPSATCKVGYVVFR